MAPESILKIIDACEKVQPNLLKHEKGYPAAVESGHLIGLIRSDLMLQIFIIAGRCSESFNSPDHAFYFKSN